eukprot:1195348-Prorocentrum_minimum.AAC.9
MALRVLGCWGQVRIDGNKFTCCGLAGPQGRTSGSSFMAGLPFLPACAAASAATSILKAWRCTGGAGWRISVVSAAK